MKLGVALLVAGATVLVAYMWARAGLGHTPETDIAAAATVGVLMIPGIVLVLAGAKPLG